MLLKHLKSCLNSEKLIVSSPSASKETKISSISMAFGNGAPVVLVKVLIMS